MRIGFTLFSFWFLLFELLSSQIIYSQETKDISGGINMLPELLAGGDDRTALSVAYNDCYPGLNYVHSSWAVTSRYSTGSLMPANFSISGIPTTATVVKAFAYWVVSFQSGSSTSPQISITTPDTVTFNYTATLRGNSGPKCWGEQGTRTFRADITPSISQNGIYQCNISGNTVWEIDGVTVLAVYIDSAVNRYGHLIIRDGCMTYLGGPGASDLIQNFNACLNSEYANAFAISSDHQNNVSPPNHSCIFNGNTTIFPNTFWNFDVATTSIMMGQSSFGLAIVPHSSDCWTWAASGLFYQVDSCDLCSFQSVPDDGEGKYFLSVYPNPAFTHFFIERGYLPYPATLELLDSFGKKVFEKHMAVNEARLIINISDMVAGLYFVRLTDEKNSIIRKLLIQR